jgi:hypothetical protein
LQAAEDDERVRVGRERAEDGGDAERRDTEREHPHLAEDVAERASDEDQRAQRQQVGIDDPLLCRQPAAEVPLNGRQGDVDDRHVDGGDRRAENRGNQRESLGAHHVSDTIQVNRSDAQDE